MNTVTRKYTGGVCEPLLSPLTIPNTCNSVGSPASEPVYTITSAGNQLFVAANLMSIGQTGGGDRIRGGGAALNFKVVGYATKEELLAATPAENTIGIITEIPITGYHFGTKEPSPAAAGMVWITTGTASGVEFNALKKNGIQVYPISAKQYISGAWVDKPAKSYQNGKWVEWFDGVELYMNGVQRVPWNQPTNAAAKMTFATDRVYGMGCIATANKIDLTRFNTLNAVVMATHYATDQTLRMGIMSSNNIALWDVSEPQVRLNKVATTKTTISLDVSNVTGEYYIALSYNHSTSGAYGTIYEVWME